MKSTTYVCGLATVLLIAAPGLALAQNGGNNGNQPSYTGNNGGALRSGNGNGQYANNGSRRGYTVYTYNPNGYYPSNNNNDANTYAGNSNNNSGTFGNRNYRGGLVGNGNGNGNGNGGYADNGNSVFNNGNGTNHPAIYANIGSGGHFGRPVPIRNGDNGGGWFGNNGGNGNAESMRPSQRNSALADNGDVRASHMIGTGVFNQNNQNLGTVHDVLIGRNGVWAVVGTNNSNQVAVPFHDFVFGNANVGGHNKVVLPDVTEAQLNSLPPFHYHLPNYASYNGNGNGNGGWFGHNNGGGWFGNNGSNGNNGANGNNNG